MHFMLWCSFNIWRSLLILLKGTCVFRRKFPPPLYNKDQTGPFRPKLEEEHYVYILEECKYSLPAGDMQVILATDVEGMLTIAAWC